jgi:UrcA family protein
MRSIALFTAALSIGAPVSAQMPVQAVTANVSTSDLDLASAQGQKMVAHRVAVAVEQVCGSYANAPEQAEQDRIHDCRLAAWSDARRQIAERASMLRLADAKPR